MKRPPLTGERNDGIDKAHASFWYSYRLGVRNLISMLGDIAWRLYNDIFSAAKSPSPPKRTIYLNPLSSDARWIVLHYVPSTTSMIRQNLTLFKEQRRQHFKMVLFSIFSYKILFLSIFI